MKRLMENDSGQGSLEAAIAIPVLFIMLLMLIQPSIVLYDRMIMHEAAVEGCRLLATKASSYGGSTQACEAYVRHRLSAVPQHDCFHIHGDECSWDIRLEGDDSSGSVSVYIGNELKALPLFDTTSTVLGMTNARGNLEISVQVSLPTQPGWASSLPAGSSPAGWLGAWFE